MRAAWRWWLEDLVVYAIMRVLGHTVLGLPYGRGCVVMDLTAAWLLFELNIYEEERNGAD